MTYLEHLLRLEDRLERASDERARVSAEIDGILAEIQFLTEAERELL